MRHLLAVLMVALGAVVAVAGERDDAPPLFLVGLLLVAGGVVVSARALLRRA